jgi:hypothetical protein
MCPCYVAPRRTGVCREVGPGGYMQQHMQTVICSKWKNDDRLLILLSRDAQGGDNLLVDRLCTAV